MTTTNRGTSLNGWLHPGDWGRFWSKVRVGSADECWEWLGVRDAKGYGRFNVHNGKTWQNGAARIRFASRVAFALSAHDPGELHVCHRCDNPACVNPRHLFLGTHQDNVADMNRKGRASGGSSPGGSNPAARLSAEQVDAIRARLEDGERQVDIAAAFGVSQSAISKIKVGRTWGSTSA